VDARSQRRGRRVVDGRASVVRILATDGETAGTGFVARAHDAGEPALIVTCAHVVEDAGSGPGGVVEICFGGPSGWTEARQSATVNKDSWRGTDQEDIAVLEVNGPLPPNVRRIALGSSARATTGRTYRTFGFPSTKPVEGLPGIAEVVDRTTEGGYEVVHVRSN
jgi:hypothetical protein